MPNDVINIQPHPRILTVLGDIEFKPWQCLAELIDNAFDEFRSAEAEVDDPTVSITLPGRQSDARTAEVWVSDNGRGMDVATLNDSIRAGWTSNARHGSLGLFGMGFNIATARLGRVTKIRTTRTGDPFWAVVTLDLPRLSRGGNYEVPIDYEPKDSQSEHGTQIIISDLKPDQWSFLSRQEPKIRDTLGDVYSYLLHAENYRIMVNGKKVKPHLPCVWGEERSVTRNGVDVPAVIHIDQPLADMIACLDCGEWHPLDVERCPDCRSERLEIRQRRIWGWIGVQRYLHKTDFGFDFLRNGRKILLKDKQLFSWEDPDGLLPPEPEYPIDNPRNEGRLVGEIHCDHVPVNYQKNAFEYETSEWKTVVRTVRGDSPLRPNIAKRRGLPENRSPLGRLYAGYRTDKPGLHYLLPGDGKIVLRDRMLEWAKLFRDGVEAYQTDDKWYEAAWEHDHPVVPEPESEDDDVLTEMGLDDGGPDAPGEPTTTAPLGTSSSPSSGAGGSQPESVEQRLQRYRDGARPIVGLGGRYEAEGLSYVDLTAWAVGQDVHNSSGFRVAVLVQSLRGSKAEAFIDVRHPLFTEYGVDTREFTLVEVAEFLRARTPTPKPLPLSVVLTDVKAHGADQKVTPGALAERAAQLLSRIREAMLPEIKGAPSGYWELLTPQERNLTESRFVIEAGDTDWTGAIESGEFIRYAPATAVVRIFGRRPDAFLDGRVFRRAYAPLNDDGARALVVSRLVGYVSELALMEERRPRLTPDELARIRLTCDLVERDLSDAE